MLENMVSRSVMLTAQVNKSFSCHQGQTHHAGYGKSSVPLIQAARLGDIIASTTPILAVFDLGRRLLMSVVCPM